MKLINTSDFSIINYTSSVCLKNYALISDELISEIRGKFYDSGIVDEDGNPVLIDLELVTKVNTSPIEGELYSNCDSLVYRDRQSAIDLYENTKINNSFKCRRYKVTVLDLGKFIKTPYQPYIAYCKERSSIVTESVTTGEGINQLTQVVAYMDYIFDEEMEFDSEKFYESDLAMISYANYSNGERIFNLEYNPVFEIFNPVIEQTVEEIPIIIE